jgi:hypothetical protein
MAYEIVDRCDAFVRISINTNNRCQAATHELMNHMDRIGIMLGATVVLTVLMCWLIPIPSL